MAKFLFWLNFIIIFYTYLGYPILIFLISLFIRRPIKKGDIEPTVSILIAAYNEEKNIADKIKNTLAIDYPKDKLEIVVVSDGSVDNTDNIVKGFEKDGVKLLRIEGRVGKTQARNIAIKHAKGEIIVFSDATTVYDRFAIRKMVRNFNDSNVGAVSGRYDYIGAGNSSIGIANILFWRYENLIKERQSMIFTLTGMSGCINSFRKNLYEPLPPHIIEDLVEPLKILEKGYRIVFEPEALAYELVTPDAHKEFKMRVRVITQGITGVMYMKKLLNPFKYGFVSFQLFSHKILRWAMPFFLIGILISNLYIFREGNIYFISIILQSTLYLFALIGYFLQNFGIKIRLFSFPLYFCTLNLASLISIFKVIRGVTIPKWETIR